MQVQLMHRQPRPLVVPALRSVISSSALKTTFDASSCRQPTKSCTLDPIPTDLLTCRHPSTVRPDGIWSTCRFARATCVSEDGHYHAAVEVVVAGRQRAQELQICLFSRRPLRKLLLSSSSCMRTYTSERHAATFSVDVGLHHHSTALLQVLSDLCRY